MSRGRVLIVDDDPDVAEALSELLKVGGFKTDLQKDAKTAIEAALAQPYTAAIIDIGLPDMDGIEVMSEIQRHQPGVRIFLMTGYGSNDVATRARQAGAHDILVKPFDVADLIRRLDEPNS